MAAAPAAGDNPDMTTGRRIGVLVPRAVAAGVVVAFAVIVIGASVRISLEDFQAYWHAGLRVREGSELYQPTADIYAADVYRYAPWFAWLWAPLTYLPEDLVLVAWAAILLAAAASVVLPLVRGRHWVALVFFAPLVLDSALGGNVQPLMLAWLLWGVDRRSGPVWIALAASLKAVPILLCLVYLGRREWGRAAVTVLLTLLLVAPAFLYDLSGYSRDAGDVVLTWGTPLYAPLILAGAAATLWLAASHRPTAWVSAGATMVLALPRVWPYDLSFVLIGLLGGRRRSPGDRDAEPGGRRGGT